MRTIPLPSQRELRELFDYDYDTGVLTWRERPLDSFKTQRAGKIWNTRFSDKPAGGLLQGGYVEVGINDILYKSHRIIWCWVTGDDPGERHVDHIDHVRDNNAWANLRLVDGHAENSRNTSMRSDNTSGVTGVHWDKLNHKWVASIHAGGKPQHLGCFDSFDAAVAARKAAERTYDYHPNHGCLTAA